MKNKLFKNLVFGIAAVLLFTTISCDSDDDLPVIDPVEVNIFCYGVDGTESFTSSAGYNFDAIGTSSGVFRTTVLITDDNLTVDDNGNASGLGSLINLDLYGNADLNFQNGTYVIGDTEEAGDVVISYSPEYDSANSLIDSIRLIDGLVDVRDYGTGYAIQIDGVDFNGDRFHGIFLGNVTQL
jgi:hypothetical protein